MPDQSRRWFAVAAVVLHAVVVLIHGAAHDQLKIGLSPAGNVFVIAVILVSPLIAAGMLLSPYARAGAWLLAVSMLGALAFGGYHHYIAMSPDHVTQTPDTTWGTIFRVTAALLVVTELLGLVAAANALRPPETFATPEKPMHRPR